MSVATAQVLWGTSSRSTIRTLHRVKLASTNIILKTIYCGVNFCPLRVDLFFLLEMGVGAESSAKLTGTIYDRKERS